MLLHTHKSFHVKARYSRLLCHVALPEEVFTLWLHSYHSAIDCNVFEVTIGTPERGKVCGVVRQRDVHILSTVMLTIMCELIVIRFHQLIANETHSAQ